MAEALRKNKKIREIAIKDTEIELSQYADDTTHVLDGSEESLKESGIWPRTQQQENGGLVDLL